MHISCSGEPGNEARTGYILTMLHADLISTVLIELMHVLHEDMLHIYCYKTPTCRFCSIHN